MRSQISFGNGIYKSTDAGKTWTHIGLEATRQIGKVIVDPRDPNVVFVAALGHVYGDLRPVRLIYLWFDDGSAIAADHHREIKEFAKLLASELWFQSLTYQQVFARLQSDSSIDPDYLSSLRSRYFATA